MIRRILKYLAAMLGLSVIAGLALLAWPLFFMFSWEQCDENHSALEQVRSLSQEELADLYVRIMELQEQYPYEQLTSFKEPYIPDDLAHLKAVYIWLGTEDLGTMIVLAKCDFSEGVHAEIGLSRDGERTIELFWQSPTEDNPYSLGSEVIWRG